MCKSRKTRIAITIRIAHVTIKVLDVVSLFCEFLEIKRSSIDVHFVIAWPMYDFRANRRYDVVFRRRLAQRSPANCIATLLPNRQSQAVAAGHEEDATRARLRGLQLSHDLDVTVKSLS